MGANLSGRNARTIPLHIICRSRFFLFPSASPPPLQLLSLAEQNKSTRQLLPIRTHSNKPPMVASTRARREPESEDKRAEDGELPRPDERSLLTVVFALFVLGGCI